MFLRQEQFADAQQVFTYARDLFNALGNEAWATRSEELRQQAEQRL